MRQLGKLSKHGEDNDEYNVKDTDNVKDNFKDKGKYNVKDNEKDSSSGVTAWEIGAA